MHNDVRVTYKFKKTVSDNVQNIIKLIHNQVTETFTI